MSNRAALGLVLLFIVGAVAVSTSVDAAALAPPWTGSDSSNPIVAENQKPGSDLWRLGRPGYSIADDVGGQIKGYASATSVLRGRPIKLYVTVSPPQPYSIDVFRIGWYQGLGGRLVRHIGPLQGITQPGCPENLRTGLIECHWSSGYTLQVPADWTSGVYVALLTNASRWQNYIVFVVRDDRPADILFQLPVNAWQAYNNYPDDGLTGKSLYETHSWGPPTMAGQRAVEVSFDRPYSVNGGAADLFRWDAYLIWWLERGGYDVTYFTDLDTHERGAELRRHQAFIAAAHDEYWSGAMFDAAETARDSGVSLAFLGGNQVYWQVRYRRSAAGVPDRIMVCYKDPALDPIRGATETVRFRDPPVNRPEQSLMGIMLENVPGDVNDPYVVQNAESWIYNGTDLAEGESVPNMVGYEYDHYVPDAPLPPHTSFTLLSLSPVGEAPSRMSRDDHANSSLYQAPSGAWVFAAGSVQWGWGLSKEGVADPRIQQMTANFLDRAVGREASSCGGRRRMCALARSRGSAMDVWVPSERNFPDDD